jgi:hypothetical protein
METKALNLSFYYEPLLEDYKLKEVHKFSYKNLNATLIVPGKFYRITDSKDARMLEIILQELVNSYIIDFKNTSHLVFYGYGKQNRYIFENIHSEEKRVAHLFFYDYEATLDILKRQEEFEIWERLSKIGLIGITFGVISYLKLKK